MSCKYYELEPRVLLDAAALVTISDTHTDNTVDNTSETIDNDQQNTQLSDIEQLVADLGHSDSVIDDNITQIIFVDSRASDANYNIDSKDNSLIVVLNSEINGIDQISNTLAKYTSLESIHIISHGDDGELLLGSTTLTADDLNDFEDKISNWKNATTEDADLLIYGCNVAESATGEAFVDLFASISGMDIAASSDNTGATSLGGDWTLEYAVGDISTQAISSSQNNILLDSTTIVNTPPTVDNSDGTLNEESTPDNPTSQVITSDMLEVVDTESAAVDIIYTVNTLPTEGILSLNNTPLIVTDTFTQDDIDNGLLTFTSNGSEAATDSFSYSVVDGDGGQLVDQTFSITFTAYSDPLEIDSNIPVDSNGNLDVTVSLTEGQILTFSNSELLYNSNSANDILYTLDSLTLTEGEMSLNGIALAVGDTFTQTDINVGNVVYTHNGDEPTAAQVFTFTVSNADINETGMMTINVTSDNDAPAPTGDGITVEEGGIGDFTNAIFHNDPDNSDIQIIYAITSLPTEGVLALNGVSISTGTLVSANNLGNLTYTHNGSDIGNDSFTVSVNDGASGTIDSYTVDITITPINDQISVITENQISEGQTYSPIIITVTDTDDALSDITIKINTLPNDGILYFDADGDGNISASDEVTAAMLASGFTITADQTNNLYFSHDGNDDNNGNPDDVTFDITVTDNGGNTGDNTDTTSVATTVTLTVTKVDDDPTLDINMGADFTIDTADNTSYSQTITNTMLLATDVDSSHSNLVYTIVSTPNDGVLRVGGIILGVGGSFSQTDIDNGDVVYTYTGETNADITDQFTFTVLDSAFNSDENRDGGIFDESNNQIISAFSIVIHDTYVNSSGTGLHLDIDGFYVDEDSVDNIITNNSLDAADGGISTGSQLVYTLASITTNGTLSLGGVELIIGSTFTQEDIENGLLSYDTNGSEAIEDSFIFSLENANGDTFTNKIFNIDVRAINDAPIIITNETLTLNEGGTATITTALINVSDVDNDIGVLNTTEMLITLNTLPANGIVYLDGAALAQYDSFTLQDIMDGLVTFEHNGLEDFQSSFDFTVSDGSLTDTGIFNIDVSPINDTPTFANTILTLTEGGEVTLTALSGNDIDGNDIDDIDQDDTTAHIVDTLSYTIDSIPAYGTLFNAGTAVKVDDIFTATELANLKYIHDGSENFSDTFSITVNDNTGATNATSSGTVTLQISPVNDDPTVDEVNSGAQLHEGQTIIINNTGSSLVTNVSGFLSANDPDSLDEQIQFRITDSVTSGTLERFVNSAWVELGVGSVFTESDLSNSYLRYTADPDYQATVGVNVDDFFKFTISDAGGGVEPTGTFNIDIIPVNDAPEINVPSNLNAQESTALTFSGLSFNDSDVTDTGTVTVTLSIDEGTLTLSSISGLTFTNGDGDNDSTMTFSGTLNDVNAAVAMLTYTPTDDYAGTTTVEVTINDQGNTGDDPDTLTALSEYSTGGDGVLGSESANSSFTIEVNAVNEAPTITLSTSTITVLEDSSISITGITFFDPDSSENGWDINNELTVTLSVNNGVLTLPSTSGLALSSITGDGSNTIIITGTIADLNAVVDGLVYAPEANFDETDNLTIKINDNGNFGEGGKLTAQETININVTPVDDDPTVNTPTSETVDEDNSIIFTLDFETVDSGTIVDGIVLDPVPDAFQVTSLPTSGALYLTDSSGNSTGIAVLANTTYTASDTAFINGEPQLIYVPVAEQNNISSAGSITFSYAVSDDIGTNYTPATIATINIEAVNDAPLITVTDAGATYTESSDGVVTPVQIVSSFNVTDLEIDGNNNENVDYNNATLTIERSTGVNANDIYSIDDSSSALTISGTDIIIDGTTIGTVSGDGSSSLSVTFNSLAMQSHIETVAKSITFSNTSDAPGDTATIAFTFNDGNDSGEQGSGGSLENTATVDISIVQSNDAPIAADNSTSINEDDTFITGNVITDSDDINGIDNDSDNTDTLTISNITYNTSTTPVTSGSSSSIDATYGTLSIDEDGSYTYTITDTAAVQELPDGGTLIESFTYEISDGEGGVDTAALAITITGTNDAPVIGSSTGTPNIVTESGHLNDGTITLGTATATGTLTSTDIDTGSTATWSGNADGTYGRLTIDSSTGQWTYTLDNTLAATQALDEGDFVNETFTVTVTDDQGATDTQDIIVTVNGTNDAPNAIAISDLSNKDRDTITPFDISNVFNDVDESDTLSYTVTNLPLGLSIDSTTGVISGTLDDSASQGGNNADGNYIVTVTATDIQGVQVSQTFTYTITQYTVTTNDINNITEDTASVTGDVLINDNSTMLTTDSIGQHIGTYGTLTLNSDGSYTYVLDNSNTSVQALSSNQSLTENFVYAATDSAGTSDSANLTITINGNNDTPTATTLADQTNLDGVTITPIDVTGSFDDIDTSDSFQYSADNLPEGLSINAETGVVSGILHSSASQGGINTDGIYIVTITATDSQGAEASSTFTYTVANSQPEAIDNIDNIAEDTINITGNVLTNDNDEDTLTIANTDVQIGNYGSLNLNDDGSYVFTLDNENSAVQELSADDTLSEVFTYIVFDDEGGEDTATLSITITGTNDAPVVTSISAAAQGNVTESGSADDGTSITGTSTITGMLTSTDADNGSATTWSGDADGIYGSLTIDPSTGQWTYTLDNASEATQALNEGDSVDETFTVTITDEQGETSTQIITVTVNGTNDLTALTNNTITITPVSIESESTVDVSENTVQNVSLSSITTTQSSEPDATDITHSESPLNNIYKEFIYFNSNESTNPISLSLILEDKFIQIEGSHRFALPENAFKHTDPNEKISIEVSLSDGSQLPSYVFFDPDDKVFVVDVLAAQALHEYEVIIKVTALDTKGNSAASTFTIMIQEEEIITDNENLDTTNKEQNSFIKQNPELNLGLKEQLQIHGEGEFSLRKTQLLVDINFENA